LITTEDKEHTICKFSTGSTRNYRWYDEFSSEKANCRNCAIGNEREGCKWINNGVCIR